MAFSLILFFVLIIVMFAGILFISVRNGVSGLKLMLLGINITIIGGIIAVDPNSNLNGIEYLIVLVGLAISIFGFGKRD